VCEERWGADRPILSVTSVSDSFQPLFLMRGKNEFCMAVLPKLALVLFLSASVLGLTGCSRGNRPELGFVQGTVTLDGKPLAGVIVIFQPEEGRPAVAKTDAQGNYVLTYVHGVKGAKVGVNVVSLTWPDGDPGRVPIPAKYGAQSTLTAEVQPGDNRFDFDLDSR